MSVNINPQRQVILDTETTGMNKNGPGPHYEGHRIIEIGAVEMINRRLTGRHFHVYIKPDRSVDPEAIQVHGITDAMLADKPSFAEIADDFIEFIQGAELIIHNAPFDIGFMDYEFSLLDKTASLKTKQIAVITDSLVMAKKMYPGKSNSLDALCTRLNIDNTKRTLHGALLDAEILADVYLKMTGGQFTLFNEEDPLQSAQQINNQQTKLVQNIAHSLIVSQLSDEEYQAHQEYLQLINKKSQSQCLWLQRTQNNEEKPLS